MMLRASLIISALVCAYCDVDGLSLLQQRAEKHSDPHVSDNSNLRQIRANSVAKMTEAEKEQVIQDMQSFISSSEEGFASIVLMGDSTMAGMTDEMLNMTQEIFRSLQLVYVSNDRTRAVHYAGFVKPGGEWVNKNQMTDDIGKLTTERAQASTKALHAKGCKSGGGLETYVARTGPLKNLVVHHWGFLPEYTDFCWDTCMTDAMAALKPTAVVWNIGFHLLNHDFSKSVCAARHNPTKTNCKDHKEMIKTGTKGMINAGVKQVVWKHTNYLCESIQDKGFPATAAALRKWNEESNRASLEKQCQTDCPQYQEQGLKCFDWFMNARTTDRFYDEANAAVQELKQELGSNASGIKTVDAYKLTRECCERGCQHSTKDGEHYTGLDSSVMANLAQVLGRSSESQ